jgi:hypothetical protein
VVLVEPGPYPTTRFLTNSVTGRNSTPASAYAELRATFQPALARLVWSAPADPQEVADTIYDAVFSKTPRLRYVVGPSAQHIARMRQGSDFETFEQHLRAILEWHVGASNCTPGGAVVAQATPARTTG